jgi:hypothetical protein
MAGEQLDPFGKPIPGTGPASSGPVSQEPSSAGPIEHRRTLRQRLGSVGAGIAIVFVLLGKVLGGGGFLFFKWYIIINLFQALFHAIAGVFSD